MQPRTIVFIAIGLPAVLGALWLARGRVSRVLLSDMGEFGEAYVAAVKSAKHGDLIHLGGLSDEEWDRLVYLGNYSTYSTSSTLGPGSGFEPQAWGRKRLGLGFDAVPGDAFQPGVGQTFLFVRGDRIVGRRTLFLWDAPPFFGEEPVVKERNDAILRVIEQEDERRLSWVR